MLNKIGHQWTMVELRDRSTGFWLKIFSSFACTEHFHNQTFKSSRKETEDKGEVCTALGTRLKVPLVRCGSGSDSLFMGFPKKRRLDSGSLGGPGTTCSKFQRLRTFLE